jgi:flagellar hook-associated protein 3 FlgL
MRVTERTKIAMLTQGQARASARLQKAARVAADATRVSKPSDDPTAFASKVRRDQTLILLERRSQLATHVVSELDVGQNSLSEAVDIIAKAREAVMNASSDTADAKNRALLGESVGALRSALLNIANTRYGSKYIFGGTRTDVAPFDETSGGFVGNDDVNRVPVMDGVAPPANISGARAFTLSGGRDIFKDLADLKTALDSNDSVGIIKGLGILDDCSTQLVRSQVEAGFTAERFRNAGEILASTKTIIVESLTREITGDPVEQLTELTTARTAYERSVAVTRELLAISTNRS